MSIQEFFSFFFFAGALISLWIKKDAKLWGSFFAILWLFYKKKQSTPLFFILLCYSLFFKLRLLPGFTPVFFTSKFAIGLQGALIGFFPLAMLVPLAKKVSDWKSVFKGTFYGGCGITLLALLATFAGATRWELKLPNFIALRLLSNLFLTTIPEEGFFRGYLQKALCNSLRHLWFGNGLAILFTSIFFTGLHLYWSPNLLVLAFVFLASLLYGIIYSISNRVESAIFTHFLLNLVHMIFFSYHAE